MIDRSGIRMRDPFVYLEGGLYHLYGTTDRDCWRGRGEGFEAYLSRDLRAFEPAGKVFSADGGFWGTENFWAPEMHPWRGAYYLFASFKAPGRRRATSILRAARPLGPFLPWGAEAVTPPEWECLDGTLYADPEGRPWVVFCHEWVQEGGGTVCARRLREDLSGPEGAAITLFSAKDAPWPKKIRHSSGVEGYVTDGPFLYRGEGGRLWLLWSSLCEGGYAAGLSESRSGALTGPWRHAERPLYGPDGGHGMIFRDLEGGLRLALHAPNRTPEERPLFLRLRDLEDRLELAGEEGPP